MTSAHSVPPVEAQDGYLVSRPHAWLVFSMAFLLMVFDFVDRQVIVSMFPYLKAEWALSDKQLGALVSVVSVTVALGSFPIALIVDRWSRVKSIAVMATVWSLATIACGFSRSYAQLFAARSVVGLGEAGYGPAAGALLSAIFPARLRGTVIGAFLAAGSIGSVLGVVLGGVISARWGWQAGFGVVGVPGLVLALLFLSVRDYKNVAGARSGGVSGAGGPQTRGPGMAVGLFRARSGVAANVGGAMQLFVVSTVYVWLPSFLNRAYGLPGSEAGMKAAIVVLVGSVGTIVWAHVADRLSHVNPRNKLRVPAAGAVMTWALLTAAFALFPPGGAQFLLIVLAGFVMTSSVGPVAAVAIDVVHPGLRARAAAMVILVQNLFGFATGPVLAGALSDAYGLQTALALVPLFCLAAAAMFVFGSLRYEADLKEVEALPVTTSGAAPSAAT